MILLAVDTSGKHGSIALARVNSPESLDVVEVLLLQGGTFSAQLVPQISALLSKHGFHKQDIAGFAVASGPGSFTGLRVGLAAIKALAEILQKPIAAVSLLEAVARAGRTRGRILAALDAGRGEVYVGEYDVQEVCQAAQERLLTRDEFLADAVGMTVVTPDGSIADLARHARLQLEEIPRPTSAAIARLGWEKILQGNTISVEQLDANYIRRSDAEIFAKPS
jgi:tRNA threonylcarbamoyladenosine biosynthesis protein TsaB